MIVLAAFVAAAGCSAQRTADPPPIAPAVTTVTPFLMFQDGRAAEAMSLYVGLLPNSRIIRLERYGPGGPGADGTVQAGEIEICGQRVRFWDSFARHAFEFTPSVSLFVDCASVDDLERYYAELSRDGTTMMPPADYGFSQRFAWVADRFGVSWQLNVPRGSP